MVYEKRMMDTAPVPVFAELPVTKNEDLPKISNVDAIPAQDTILKLNKGNLSIELANLSGKELLTFVKELLTDA